MNQKEIEEKYYCSKHYYENDDDDDDDTAYDNYVVLGVKNLNPKKGTIPYWIIKHWRKEAEITINDLIDQKISKYVEHLVKTVSIEIHKYLIANKKELLYHEVRPFIENYLESKKFKTVTPITITLIHNQVTKRAKKYIKSSSITLDDLF